MLRTSWWSFGLLLSSRQYPKAICCLFQLNTSCTLSSLFSKSGVDFTLICWYMFLRACTSWRIGLESWDVFCGAHRGSSNRGGGPRLIHDLPQQGSDNCCLWARSGPIPVAVKFYWNSHAYQFAYCLWLLLHCKGRGEWLQRRLFGQQSLKYLWSGFYNCRSLIYRNNSYPSSIHRPTSIPIQNHWEQAEEF